MRSPNSAEMRVGARGADTARTWSIALPGTSGSHGATGSCVTVVSEGSGSDAGELRSIWSAGRGVGRAVSIAGPASARRRLARLTDHP